MKKKWNRLLISTGKLMLSQSFTKQWRRRNKCQEQFWSSRSISL